MKSEKIVETISELLAEIVDEDLLDMNRTTTADDVEDWDSLAHVKLVLALEKHYDFSFDVSEIAQPENVGELADIVLANIKKSGEQAA